jgi:hypothetical protein
LDAKGDSVTLDFADSLGEMLICSGDAWRYYRHNGMVGCGVLPGGAAFSGTCVSILFDRGQIANFQEMVAPGLFVLDS